MLSGSSHMYIFTKPDGIMIAPDDIQLCSYFSLFIAIPDTTRHQDNHRIWSREEILDRLFILKVVHEHIPDGINAQVFCWRIHFAYDDENSRSKILTAEYRVVLLGVNRAITEVTAAYSKQMVEEKVQKMTIGTKNGAWKVSNVIPRSLLFQKSSMFRNV